MTASIATAASGTRHRVGAGGAELRSEPAAGAELLGRLDPGTRLLEFRRQGDWIKVAVFGAVEREGWVAADEVEPEPQPPRTTSREAPDASGPAPQRPAARQFVLLVEGPVAHAFRGRCRLQAATGEERAFDLTGLMPQRYDFEGRWLSCSAFTLEARRLTLELWADGQLLEEDSAGLVLLEGGGVAQGRARVAAPRAWR